MTGDKKYSSLFEAILCSFALMVFSWFIHYDFPVRLISFTALILTAYIIGKDLRSPSDLKKITGEFISIKETLLYSAIGILGGILLAILFRWHLKISLFPKSISSFAIVAAVIGSFEEVVFRGYIQESAKSLNAPFSILFSTISHTGYKCSLFLSPVITSQIDIGFLAIWTFVAGILFGTIRHLSKSIFPSLIAHALFDILVYAEFVRAPWWVW